MKGSEKQIKWAETIKASKDFSQWLGKGKDEAANAVLAKAVAFIEAIDAAAFWIDNRDRTEQAIITDLLAGRLQPKGWQHDQKAKIDMSTGVITLTETVIVSDGRGGHKETKVTTLQPATQHIKER